MSTKGWRKNTSITRKLSETPYDYPFLQAIRLLERSALFEKQASSAVVATNPIAKFTPSDSETLRFIIRQSLAFPSSEIGNIRRVEKNTGVMQWEIEANIMALTGAMGVLPFHYTELLLKRKKEKDETMGHFFDLFNHRTLSLFFESSVKYRLPLQYERYQLHQKTKSKTDPHTQILLSLIGLGTPGLSNRLHIRDESLINYCGLFNQQIRTSTGLKQLLRSYFGIPVEVDQFVGQWQDLIEDVRARLPDQNHPEGRNVCLGRTAILGKKGWFAQGKIRVVLGPLNKLQLEKFTPGTDTLAALNEMVRLYAGVEHDYEFIIRIRKSDVPSKIRLDRNKPPVIGWNTWLSNKLVLQKNKADTMDIAVSANAVV